MKVDCFNGRYILDEEGNPLPCISLLAWATWIEENNARRVVARDKTPGGDVSTVFLGLDHRFGRSGPPLVFESLIFGGPLADTIAWSSQRLRPGDPSRMAGSAFGIDELDLFRCVEHYVLIGSEGSHALDRKIFKKVGPVEVLAPPWLRSRASLRDDRIWVFHNPQPVREDAPAAPPQGPAPAVTPKDLAPQRTSGESAPPSARRLL